jgi:hypothetical protein
MLVYYLLATISHLPSSNDYLLSFNFHFINTYRAFIIARKSRIVVADSTPPYGGIARPKGSPCMARTAAIRRCSVCPPLTFQQELYSLTDE